MQAFTVTFRLDGITHEQYLAGCEEVAPAFAAVPGLISKTWLADEPSGLYGGLYLFATEPALSGTSPPTCSAAASPATRRSPTSPRGPPRWPRGRRG